MNAKIVAYRRGFETNSALVNAHSFGSDAGKRDGVLRLMQSDSFMLPASPMQLVVASLTGEAPPKPERYARIDAVNETDFYDFGRGGPVDVLMFYHEPMPSAALSLELAVDLHHVGARHWDISYPEFAGTRHVLCRSHQERLRLAEHLAHSKGGLFELDGQMYDITGIRLVDRTVVYASRRSLRRSNIGSPVALDRAFTDKLSPLMEALAPVEVTVDIVHADIVNADVILADELNSPHPVGFGVEHISVDAVDIKARKVY